MLRNLSEKQIKILKGIQIICFGCFNQSVQDNTGFGSIGRFNQNKIFPTKSKWTDCLLGVVIVHRNVAIGEKDTQIFFLIDAVCKSFADGTVWDYLGIFLFYPREISINFLRENKLTLLLAIRYRQIIKSIIYTQHFGDHVISLLGDGLFDSRETDRFYKVCKRSSDMDPAAGNFEIFPFFFKFVADLIENIKKRGIS